MRILITGGHLTPALAIIEQLKNEQVFYVGRKHTFEGDNAESLEYHEITNLGIPFINLKTGRFQRKITIYTFPSLLKLPQGFFRALKILKKIKPDVVVSFGGYISVPVGLAASLLKIPLIIHEQTLEIGLANKILSKFATKICLSWESNKQYFPSSKSVITGNPIRSEVVRNNTKAKENIIYISGGSSGSHAINLMVEEIIPKLLEKFSVIHQTGDSSKYRDFDRLNKLKNTLTEDLKERYQIEKFLTPTNAYKTMNNSTLFIGRSGINTVTELIILQKPSLLIPLPISQKNEQFKNAKFLFDSGLGEYELQNNLTAEKLYSKILFMTSNIQNYKLKKDFVTMNGADNLVKIIRDVATQKAS